MTTPTATGDAPENPQCMRCSRHLGMPFHETSEHDQAAAVETGYTDVAFDNDTRRYIELAELLDTVSSEMAAIKERFRALGNGEHKAPSGVLVAVTAPNRSFNLPRATELLSEEQLALCKRDGYDPKKVRNFLAPALLEICMDPGAGELRVSVK